MGLLAWAASLAVLVGCYAPSFRDCAVRCSGPSDCASGQICGDDGLCASPEIAGSCAMATVDAGPGDDAGPPPPPPPRDAAAADAVAAPDGPTTVKLHVQVDGKGSIQVDGRGLCSSADPRKGDCMYDIASNVAQRVQAMPIQLDQVFLGWTSMTCAGQSSVCTFTPSQAATIVAKFGHP